MGAATGRPATGASETGATDGFGQMLEQGTGAKSPLPWIMGLIGIGLAFFGFNGGGEGMSFMPMLLGLAAVAMAVVSGMGTDKLGNLFSGFFGKMQGKAEKAIDQVEKNLGITELTKDDLATPSAKLENMVSEEKTFQTWAVNSSFDKLDKDDKAALKTILEKMWSDGKDKKVELSEAEVKVFVDGLDPSLKTAATSHLQQFIPGK